MQTYGHKVKNTDSSTRLAALAHLMDSCLVSSCQNLVCEVSTFVLLCRYARDNDTMQSVFIVLKSVIFRTVYPQPHIVYYYSTLCDNCSSSFCIDA